MRESVRTGLVEITQVWSRVRQVAVTGISILVVAASEVAWSNSCITGLTERLELKTLEVRIQQ